MNPKPQKPNIILINCDDLGYGDVGCYGSQVNRTPAIDRLAAEGIRFTDFCMASSICSPSRAAMLTGCYPKRLDLTRVLFPGQAEGLNPNEITLASLLKQAGYATQLIGKWHCGDQPEFLPTRHGFDHYFGLPYSNDMGRQCDAVRWDREAPPLPLLLDEQVIQAQPDQASLTERYVEQSVRFIRANRHQPFFLYLAHMHVHLPLIVAPRFLKQARNGAYGAAVECIDWSVAVIQHELQTLGLEDNTLVIFTSDNGSRGDHGGTNHPLRGAKHNTWEGGYRVPCILRWKGVIPPGTTSSELVTGMDFFPTLASLCHLPIPTDRIIDGRDITALLTQEPGARSPHQAFFYYRINDLEAVRSGNWKLHIRKDGRDVCWLFDLASDAAEKNDVSGAHPGQVAHLKSLLDEARADLGDAVTGTPGRNCRPGGRVPHPVPLTRFEPDSPYMWAEYDHPERG
jgi:arylsulfatase A-like enzyme